jgi:hypothetical protein
MKYKRFLPLLTPVLIWLLSQAFLIIPQFFYSALALGTLLIVISVKLLVGRSAAKNWLLWAVAPLLFFLSLTTYTAIITNHFWMQFIFLLIVWFLFSYLRNLFYQAADGVSRFKSDDLLMVGGFLAIAAAAAVLFDLPAFLNWPLPIMLLIFALISWLSFIQFYPMNGSLPSHYGLMIANVLILTELAGVLALLPLNFNILALFLAIIYYLLLTVMRLNGRGILNRHFLTTPLILSAIAISLLLLMARWL